MARSGELFEPCERWALEPSIVAPDGCLEPDCVNCAHQYEDAPCPEFRRRLLRLLLPAVRLETHETTEVTDGRWT